MTCRYFRVRWDSLMIYLRHIEFQHKSFGVAHVSMSFCLRNLPTQSYLVSSEKTLKKNKKYYCFIHKLLVEVAKIIDKYTLFSVERLKHRLESESPKVSKAYLL